MSVSLPFESDDPPKASLRGARVVVTGARGFIGNHLRHALTAQGAETFVLRRKPSAPSDDSMRSIVADLTDRRDARRVLRELAPDIVFHLAGFVSGDRSPSAIARAYDGNVVPSANLLLACADERPETRVVLATSLETSKPWRSAADTGSPYGVSKLMIEVLAGGMHKLAGGNAVCARIGMVYGPNDRNRHRLVPSVITSLLRGRSAVASSGTRLCDFVYIDDVVGGLCAIACTRELDEVGLDVGRGELIAVREVAERIYDLINPDAASELVFDDSLDRPNEQERAADAETTFRATGFRAHVSLQAGLARTIAWHRAQLMAANTRGYSLNRPS
jgi:nucleoside-diphosphate-sugar epimerase